MQGTALALTGIATGSGAVALRAEADEPSLPAHAAVENAAHPFQGLLENEGHSYRNWGLSRETSPAVYVEPLSYADVQRVAGDPLQFPAPVSVVGALMSVTATVVNNGGTLLCTRKLDAILGLETDAAGRQVVRVQAGCRLKKLHMWLQDRGLEIPFQAEIGDATVGSVAAGDTKDSSLDGPGYFSAGVTALTYVDQQGGLRTLDQTGDPVALAEFKCSYGLSGIIVECLVAVRPASLCRSRFSLLGKESPEQLAVAIRQMQGECDALWASVVLDRLSAMIDQRWKAGEGIITPASSQPASDALRLQRRNWIQHGGAPPAVPGSQPHTLPRELVYSRADFVNEYWRPQADEKRLDFQYYEHDLTNLERVLVESYAFTKRFQQEHGFAPHAWSLYFVRRREQAEKPFGLYSGGPGISFSFDPVFSNPVDLLWQRFARDYNQIAIHVLGGRGSPIQTQWLTPADLTIPSRLARPRFTTAYYAQFLG